MKDQRFFCPSTAFRAAFYGFLVGGIFLSSTQAGTKKSALTSVAPSSPSAPAAAVSARVRLWKASDSPMGNDVRVRWLEQGKTKKAVDLFQGASQYQFSDYQEIPVGTGIIETALVGKGSTLLPVNLTEKSRFTLLVRIQGGDIYSELINDDVASPANFKNFNAYNLLLAARGVTEITLGEVLKSASINPGGSLRLRGLKPALYQISVSGTDAEGKPFRWNGETDLRNLRRSTLLICPDAYGRMRPRLVEDEGITPLKEVAN